MKYDPTLKSNSNYGTVLVKKDEWVSGRLNQSAAYKWEERLLRETTWRKVKGGRES
jgi:hypothetical protein